MNSPPFPPRANLRNKIIVGIEGHMEEDHCQRGKRERTVFDQIDSSGRRKTKADPVDPVDPPRLPQCTDVVKSPKSLDI